MEVVQEHSFDKSNIKGGFGTCYLKKDIFPNGPPHILFLLGSPSSLHF